MTPPLAGLRVIDMSTVVAGPGCARYLADFGATVIKVERPGGGDTTRAMGFVDPNDPDGTSLFWKLVGRNKASVVLDLKDPADRDQLLRLVDGADVLVENLRPGGIERLGLGPDELHARNPGLVITRITGFGQDGPYRVLDLIGLGDDESLRSFPGRVAARDRIDARMAESMAARTSGGALAAFEAAEAAAPPRLRHG